ncbi:MAG: ClpXP protease specificity-enhancing factor SspB [Alphaproteobacteria bacterium]|nr:ClpXP protease specificity-enhancing factor SspB [Alphaproteobacteria bacterium]
MTEDLLRYDLMIEGALRNVVRETLTAVAQNGLPGDHHFYITFLTNFPGVEIPDYLRKQYPDEMTIVLQYQFFGLKIEDDYFSATLSFNNVKERLKIPLEAITTFADPSVNFALQFQSGQGDDEEGDEEGPPEPSGGKGKDDKSKTKAKDEKRGEVISLDMFRKK